MITGRETRAHAAASAAASSLRDVEEQLRPEASGAPRRDGGGFDAPEPLSLAELAAVKRAALFG